LKKEMSKKTVQTKKKVVVKENKPTINPNVWYPLVLFVCVLIGFFFFAFDTKLHVSGDNATYFKLGKSIAEGYGFVNLSSPAMAPTNSFPPGYPLLMSIFLVFTDSIIIQKVMNGIYLFGGIWLLFEILKLNGINRNLALAVSIFGLFNHYVLQFGAIMMSEAAFIFFSFLSIYLLLKSDREKPFWKDYSFLGSIAAAAFIFHIRSQGVALLAGIILLLLVEKDWKRAIVSIGTYALLLAPWIIRNKIHGLSGNRYISQIMMRNHWRPEEGMLNFGELVDRFFVTLQMLITKAIPNSTLPFFEVNYGAPTTGGEWVMGILVILIILYGFFRHKKIGWMLLGYFAAVLGIISLWSAPGQNRYIVTIIPLMQAFFFVGLYHLLILLMVDKLQIMKKAFSPFLLLVFLIPMFDSLNKLKEESKRKYPPAYDNYFKIARQVKRSQRDGKKMIACRKPDLFYVFSDSFTTRYKFTSDNEGLIKDLIDRNVDYVILEQLGYASTYNYLYPAIQKYQSLFKVEQHLQNPDTYLLAFDRENARRILNY
jgi:hypothetical protein